MKVELLGEENLFEEEESSLDILRGTIKRI